MNRIPHIHLLGLGNQVAAVLLADKRDTHDTMPSDPDIHGRPASATLRSSG
jgi:hypothetical protein